MITLTDDEQATALRAARYSFAALERGVVNGTSETKESILDKLKRVIAVLEKQNDNGMWRCLCPNPWRHPTCLVCPTCGMAGPA